MAEVAEYRKVQDLEDLRERWHQLWLETPGATIFQTLDWLLAQHECNAKHQKLKVLTIHDRGELIGIVPLVVVNVSTRIGRVRVLTLPLDSWGSKIGPVGPRGYVALTAALWHLKGGQRDWDVIDMRWINPDDDQGGTRRALNTAGFSYLARTGEEVALVDTSQSWEEYLASRTGKFRNNLRRAEKNVSKLGEVTFERFRAEPSSSPDYRWDLYEECVEVSRQSWQFQTGDGVTLASESVDAFLRRVHKLAVETGQVDVCVLRIDGRAVAFAYNYVHDGHVTGVRVGCDERWAKAGLGNVLIARILQDCCEREDTSLELGPGSMHFKKRWLTHTVRTQRFTHYSWSPRLQILQSKHRFESKRTHQEKPTVKELPPKQRVAI